MWISSIVIVDAMADIASTNRPWTISFSAAGFWVRSPRVRAAVETPASVGTTRTKNSAMMSMRILFLVIRDCSPSLRISTGIAFMSTRVMSWTIGMISAPPPITTRSPPRPVRTKDWSLDECLYNQCSR